MPPPRRYAKRRDKAEPEIIETLRHTFGADISIDQLDLFDLLVHFAGRTICLEVKTGKGKLNEGQLLWHLTCTGENYAVNSAADAVCAVRGQLLQSAPEPRFAVYQSVPVAPENGWQRIVKARKYLLGEWWYLIDGDEAICEAELVALM